jgi:hypothetical protein
MARGESDQPIVLGDGRADHKGKGLTEVRSWQRKHCPVTGRNRNANLTAGDSKEGSGREIPFSGCPIRKRVLSKSPVLENGTPGSVRGRSGNRPSYRDNAERAFSQTARGSRLPAGPLFRSAVCEKA